MPQALDLSNAVENVLSSYEARVQGMGSVFDATHLILGSFQESVLDTKEEREKISTELRDILAKNEHLRKKDFNNMMRDILESQDEREKEVRGLLRCYLDEQKQMTRILADSLKQFKNALAKGEIRRIEEFQSTMKDVVAKQDERKNEVTSKLKEFQKEQQEMAAKLRALLARGRELRIKDLKSMLKEFEVQRRDRIAHKKERRKEVLSMLGDFNKQRMEGTKNWQAAQRKVRGSRQEKVIPPEILVGKTKEG